jgi:hypothetical protein
MDELFTKVACSRNPILGSNTVWSHSQIISDADETTYGDYLQKTGSSKRWIWDFPSGASQGSWKQKNYEHMEGKVHVYAYEMDGEEERVCQGGRKFSHLPELPL